MVFAAAVRPRFFPAALVAPVDHLRTANPSPSSAVVARRTTNLSVIFPSSSRLHTFFCGSDGVLPQRCARMPAQGCIRHARSNNATAIRFAAAPLHPRAASVTSASAVKPSLDYDVHVREEDDRCMDRIGKIKAMLGSMGEGEISISAYATAWVALVPDLRGNRGPQFPSSLQWIEDNQLPDGSWGDNGIFIVYNRLLATLACVIALKTWGVCPDRCQRGVSFICQNVHRLSEEDDILTLCGFEVIFPTLIDMAQTLDLQVPYDAPALRDIYARRALKLERIPRDMVHEVPTTLLFSLEGLTGLDWKKLLRLQSADGSFLTSPSTTAFALMQTGDDKCLGYIEKIVQRFNGGVPAFYPLDMMERLWAVDRLERLGISRYFQEEIGQSLDYIYKYWTESGIGGAKNTILPDVDDTSMGFHLLRLHGYDVSADVFGHFQKEGEFFCYVGELDQGVSHVFNLNRASQVSFPGEKILEQARMFTHRFLREKQARNQLSDKWIISKDLAGEVGYGLDFPWYASLPRVETRFYLEQYGGSRDVWISKDLYRLPMVCNDDYLEAARSDFSRCQAVYRVEWLSLQRWYDDCGLGSYGVSRGSLLRCYFLAAASIFEPERAAERLGWARTAILAQALSAGIRSSDGGMRVDVNELTQALSAHAHGVSVATVTTGFRPTQEGKGRGLIGFLVHALDGLSQDAAASLPPGSAQAAATQRQICQHLRRAWEDWILAWREQQDGASLVSGWWPGGTENGETGLLLVRSLELCAGRTDLEELLQAKQYAPLRGLISSLCRKLCNLRRHNPSMAEWQGEGDKRNSNREGDGGAVACQGIEPEMQELMGRVLRPNPDGGNRSTLQTFLTVAKTFYYVAICPPATLEHHIAKVLFEEPVYSTCR